MRSIRFSACAEPASAGSGSAGMTRLFLPMLLFAAACTPVSRSDEGPAGSAQQQRDDPAPVPASPAAPADVVQGNADFGLALYKELAAEPGDVFLSPISIAGAFGPVVAGAQGETRDAIARAMRFPARGGAGLHPALGGMLRGLEREQEGATLSIANALWVRQGFALKPEFLRVARQDYDAAVEPLDFARAPAAAAGRINGWVSRETRGRIPELISADSLNQDTALVVTNAVYFLGDWPTPFNASNTSEQPFYTGRSESRPIPLMYRKDSYRYLETDDFQAIDLPYKDPRLSMTVFLPKARDGLASFERRLDETRLRTWLGDIDKAEPRTVYLYLPKLKVEATYNLVPALRALGMGIAFSNRADFRGMADADLLISQVVHKTFVRVDEKGTEAAAATGVEIELTSAPSIEPPTFRADHPFFFLLRDRSSGAMLFLGRIVAPERP